MTNSQMAYSEKATLDLAELAPTSARLHDLKQVIPLAERRQRFQNYLT